MQVTPLSATYSTIAPNQTYISMTPSTKTHSNDIAAHHQSHQNHGTGSSPRSVKTHGVVTAANATSYTTDNQLAGLVEAATAAAGQSVGWAQPEGNDTTMAGDARALQNQLDYSTSINPDDGVGNPGNTPNSHYFLSLAHGPAAGRQLAPATESIAAPEMTPSGRKRKRGDPNVDPAITANSSFSPGGTSGKEHGASNSDDLSIRDHPPQQVTSNARAAGVHSAVALFRQPSSTSKKYTRPPMSKLFASLELSPENFLHLQAAAKNYMLDDNHPDRRDCVGQRGKGDTEMVRLKLWNCVSNFLGKEGNGPRFFGENVVNEGMEPRQLIWPRDDQKIISLMMPLLRRMVTNERQRQYAIETRKGGSAEEKKRKRATAEMSDAGASGHAAPFQSSPDDGTRMLDLLTGGYPSDWESITQCYNSYNQDYRLGQLATISGLPEPDWLGLVAGVDCHYQVDHHGNGADCDQACEDYMINQMISTDSVLHANWRVGEEASDGHTARTYFASGIIRDVSHIIKDTLMGRVNPENDPKLASSTVFSEHSNPETFPQSSSTSFKQTTKSTNTLKILVHFVQDGDDKCVLPRLELPYDPNTGLSALLKNAQQYYQQRHPQGQQFPLKYQVKVWLKNGLVPVRDDGEWMTAVMTAHMVDWMDGELRVIVDCEGNA